MTLSEGLVGQTYTVSHIGTDTNIKRRLQALGMIKGTKLTLLSKKRSGTSVFYVRGSRLAVGKKIAAGIEISGGSQ